ncbi:hypothetical protein [Pontibacter litorisediminis]|uniref:hypothetical protein n=1 Tax=Pontibacter litorisediminis TaxID=1846260 RepID=UPI0023EB72B7|nr:hypothetical protein [Pontibacter litorisediminis]
MPATLLTDRHYLTALQEQHLTLRYYPTEKLLCSEWRGVVPSEVLRQGTIYVCQYVLDYNIERILADYSRLVAPSLEDQLWIANRSEHLLRQSKVSRVASVLAPEFFQPPGGRSSSCTVSAVGLSFELHDFGLKADALHWLMLD